MSAAPSFAFAGQSFQMLADRALFWPRHAALIVADLHLEKGSWYAALGQPLPPYDSHDTLDRLAALAAETDARAIWCLGDSFHDRDAAERIVINGMDVNDLPVSFADSQAFRVLGLHDRPALLLGMDSLSLFDRVEIDFPNRRVVFDLPDGATRQTGQRFAANMPARGS